MNKIIESKLFSKKGTWSLFIKSSNGESLCKSTKTKDLENAKKILERELKRCEQMISDGKSFDKKKGLYKVGNLWYYNVYIKKNKNLKKSTGCSDYNDAVKFFEREIEPFKEDLKGKRKRIKNKLYTYSTQLILSEKWQVYINKIKNNKKAWIWKSYIKLRGRQSVIKNRDYIHEFKLSYSDLINIVLSSNGRCQVTGIPFSNYKPEGKRISPYMPSIDRIDSSDGYVKENCRLVCFCVNLAMNEWGEEVIEKIGLSYIYKKLVSDYEEKLTFEQPIAYNFDEIK